MEEQLQLDLGQEAEELNVEEVSYETMTAAQLLQINKQLTEQLKVAQKQTENADSMYAKLEEAYRQLATNASKNEKHYRGIISNITKRQRAKEEAISTLLNLDSMDIVPEREED